MKSAPLCAILSLLLGMFLPPLLLLLYYGAMSALEEQQSIHALLFTYAALGAMSCWYGVAMMLLGLNHMRSKYSKLSHASWLLNYSSIGGGIGLLNFFAISTPTIAFAIGVACSIPICEILYRNTHILKN